MSAEKALRPLAGRLRAWGLHELTATLLEQGGPLPFLGAQFLHIAAPTASLLVPADTLAALAQVLEDPEARQAWAHELADASVPIAEEGHP
jgi:hypothetical protein